MKRRPVVILLAVLLLVGGILSWYLLSSRPTDPVTTKPPTLPKQSPSDGTIAQPSPTTGSFDKNKLSHTDPASIWAVVNKQHPLSPKTYAPADLQPAGNGQQLRAAASTDLQRMFADAKRAGLTLTAASGYRSYDTQVRVYANEVKTYGQAQADSQSARPGYSEHQTGLGIDIAGGGCNIEDCFGNTAEGKWAATNAYKYGYILRYTAANSAVTGYRAEPWHFRYVGTDLAIDMQSSGMTTLEEYFGVSGGNIY